MDVVLSSEEWRSVLKRLGAFAKTLVSVDVVAGLGIGPEDLVYETLRRLWDPATTVKWSADKGSPTVPAVVGYLKVVLKNYFLDCLRKGAYTHTAPGVVSGTDCEDARSLGPAPAGSPGSSERLVDQILVTQLYSRARFIAEAEDDVEVVLYLDLQVDGGGPYQNAEAAVKLGVTPADVVNIKKRLGRILARARQPQAAARART